MSDKTPECDTWEIALDISTAGYADAYHNCLAFARSLETRLRQAEADLSDERAKNEMAEHKLVVEREALKADLVKARDTALEDAAKVCNDIIYVPHGDGSYTGMFRHFGNQQCAAAIRAMKGK